MNDYSPEETGRARGHGSVLKVDSDGTWVLATRADGTNFWRLLPDDLPGRHNAEDQRETS